MSSVTSADYSFNSSFHNLTVECLLSQQPSVTFSEEVLLLLTNPPPSPSSSLTPSSSCLSSFDGLICWPATPAASYAIKGCVEEFNGIKYNATQNVTRYCHPNATWSTADYSRCQELIPTESALEVEISAAVYYVGYVTSLLALIVAVGLFLWFKDLRCLRNIIHTNLMFSYILSDLTWIITLTLQMSVETNAATSVFLMLLLHYFHLTNFFWMFVEGLYLYMLVVETFSGERIKLRVYAIVGWGCPALIVLVWTIVKIVVPAGNSDGDGNGDGDGYNIGIKTEQPWLQQQVYDWIYVAPAIAILTVNLVFLIVIMWVLITKLRSAHTPETQQYLKAAKALLVLVPLLGITYVLVIVNPTGHSIVFDVCRSALIATQGLTVALLYCFLNAEVQNSLRHHHQRWKTAKSFRDRRATFSSRDYSPRSRTESVRLYSQPFVLAKKRESSASDATTTTLVNKTNGSAL